MAGIARKSRGLGTKKEGWGYCNVSRLTHLRNKFKSQFWRPKVHNFCVSVRTLVRMREGSVLEWSMWLVDVFMHLQGLT